MSLGLQPKKKKDEPKQWNAQRGSQMAFHQSGEIFELLYGGAAGGGKSQSLLTEACRYIHIPTYKGIIFRRTFPEIEKSLVPVAYELFGDKAKAKNRGTEWHFHSGAIIYLSHLQHEEDKEKHKSAEYDYIAFDELTSFTETMYTYLFSRCRGSDNRIVRHIRSGTNPTGIGHGWVKQRFLECEDDPKVKLAGYMDYDYACGWRDPAGKVHTSFSTLPDNYYKGDPEFSSERYKVWEDKISGLQRAFIPALLWGNQILLKSDPQYVKRLMALPEKTQKALLYGSWDLFEGQFFSEWDPNIHVVDGFVIPDSWRKFVAIDYGYAAPFCALWFALDPDGILYCYRELYARQMTTDDQAQTILDLSKDDKSIEWFTADPSLFTRQGSGESHADVYGRHGLHLIASSNKRVAGWALMHEYLGGGKLKFFRNCVNSIRTIPSLAHAKRNPDDLDTTQEDHAADVVRYMLLTLRGLVTNVTDHSGGSDIPEWFKKIQAKKKRRTVVRRMRL